VLTALGAGSLDFPLCCPSHVAGSLPRTRSGALGVLGAATALADCDVLRRRPSCGIPSAQIHFAVMVGGALLIAAAVAMQFVGEPPDVTPISHTVADEAAARQHEPPEAPAT
jgi:hypothetical protein